MPHKKLKKTMRKFAGAKKRPAKLLDATKGKVHQRGLPGTKNRYNRTENTSMS